jgi:hypothetical protein
MPTQNPSQSPDSYSRLRLTGRSLRQQLTWRLVLVFLLVAMMGSLMVLFGYRAIVNYAQRDAADETARHIQRSYASMQDSWQRNAEEVKAQIDFMRIFAVGQTDSWLRLRAYFAALEGKVGKFPSGVVLSGNGHRYSASERTDRRWAVVWMEKKRCRGGFSAASTGHCIHWSTCRCGWVRKAMAVWY